MRRVYYALRKLLRRNKAESHLVYDELVVTAEEYVYPPRQVTGAAVDGAAPEDGRVAPASRARLTAPGVKTEKHGFGFPGPRQVHPYSSSGERAHTLPRSGIPRGGGRRLLQALRGPTSGPKR